MATSQKAQAINPFTGKVISEYDYLTNAELTRKLQQSWDSFLKYRDTTTQTRAEKLNKLADVMNNHKEKIAKTITLEQGKPIKEARAEVEKAIKHSRFYASHLEEFQKPAHVKNDAKKSYVVFQPLGPVFHITPFNFPFWLIFKGVLPAIAFGNTILNKNPSSCPETGILAEQMFREAGFDNDEFLNINSSQKQTELIISNKGVRGVSFTGSTAAGSQIASLAGQYIKKAVLELGGSDPFIVFDDANIDMAVDHALQSRLRNAGQVCTAAKRFIIQEGVYNEFRDKLVNKVKNMKVGDPLEEDTEIGPFTKKNGVDAIVAQVKKAQEQGGKVILGGAKPTDEKLQNGNFYLPTIVEVELGNVLLTEETFGPVFALVKFQSEEEAVNVANDTEYGLGGAVFSGDEERGERVAAQIETGSVYINHMLSSGSDMPGGGVKNSGFGREGGIYGAHEFVNIKTIWMGKGAAK